MTATMTPEGNPGPVLTQTASRGDDVLMVGTSPGLRPPVR